MAPSVLHAWITESERVGLRHRIGHPGSALGGRTSRGGRRVGTGVSSIKLTAHSSWRVAMHVVCRCQRRGDDGGGERRPARLLWTETVVWLGVDLG